MKYTYLCMALTLYLASMGVQIVVQSYWMLPNSCYILKSCCSCKENVVCLMEAVIAARLSCSNSQIMYNIPKTTLAISDKSIEKWRACNHDRRTLQIIEQTLTNTSAVRCNDALSKVCWFVFFFWKASKLNQKWILHKNKQIHIWSKLCPQVFLFLIQTSTTEFFMHIKTHSL